MREIAIEVPEAEDQNIAFVAMPQSGDFDFLHDLIVSAANKAGLKAEQVYNAPTHDQFLAAIIARTRHSKVVVAICSPATAPNPNVMYELGMAHAIGKATIILTDSSDSLPANLQGKTALQHPPADANRNEKELFVYELVDLMRGCVGRVTNGLTDTRSYRDIHVIDASAVKQGATPQITSDTFWNSIVIILTFAKDVRQGFHAAMAIDLTDFREAVENIFNQFGLPPGSEGYAKHYEEAKRAWKAWGDYAHQYNGFLLSFINVLERRQKKAESAYDALRDIGNDSLLASRGFFEAIARDLPEYSRVHNGLTEVLPERPFHTVFFQCLQKMEYVQNLATEANRLSAEMTNLITNADSLIFNLIQATREIPR